MAADLDIILVQPQIHWGDIEANLLSIDQIIDDLPETDLVILPEMFNTGFLMDTSLADASVAALDKMREWSGKAGAAVAGSIMTNEGEKYFNRFYLVENKNISAKYDKRHLFGLMNEHSHFSAGTERIAFDIKGWRIQPFICYDLRFPAWCRNSGDIDLQLFVANWPDKRIHHWDLLLRARAVENQCFTAGCNVVGTDSLGNVYRGNSGVYDFTGDCVTVLKGKDGWVHARLSKKDLSAHREHYPFLPDRDKFIFE
jgi:predicted amidohydrolase